MLDLAVTNGMDSRVWLLITLLFYALGALHALLFALLRRSVLTTVSLTATLLGFAFHTAALALRWREAGHFPAVGLRDGASLLAWGIVLVFLLVYVTTRVDAAGLFAYPFAFALVFIANLTPATERADPVLRSLYLPVHVFLAVFGYGALFVAFTHGHALPLPGAGAALALAAALLLPDPEPRALGHDRRPQRAGRLRLPDARDRHGLPLEPQPARVASGPATRRSGRRSRPGSSTS